MKILIYGFSGKILGGIETFILNMNEHMSKDMVFDYIIDGNECFYKERIVSNGGEVFFVPRIRKNPLGYLLCFCRILRRNRADISIIYVQLFSMANVLPILLAKWYGYKIILHAHNSGLESKNRVYKFFHLIGKVITKYGNYTRFTNSQKTANFMFGKNVRSELIYNAIDMERFFFAPNTREEVRNELGAVNKVVIGFVGRFSPPKNPIFMLNIFAEFSKIVEKCELWIVGEGDMKKEMECEAPKLGVEKKIKWLGRRDDVNKLMMGMDLLLQPSTFEGLGIALVEAQATGLPVVASAHVIPQEAAVTPLIKFVTLGDGPFRWAEECVRQIKEFKGGERQRFAIGFPENYDIKIEARRLEQLIRGSLG